jgi:hypothetical protein
VPANEVLDDAESFGKSGAVCRVTRRETTQVIELEQLGVEPLVHRRHKARLIFPVGTRETRCIKVASRRRAERTDGRYEIGFNGDAGHVVHLHGPHRASAAN